MSRRKIEQEVTRKERLTISACDLCGVETKPGRSWPQPDGWSRNDTEIEARIGKVFPEGDFRKLHRLDVCPSCFEDRFIPEVEKLFGVKFSVSDPEDG